MTTVTVAPKAKCAPLNLSTEFTNTSPFDSKSSEPISPSSDPSALTATTPKASLSIPQNPGRQSDPCIVPSISTNVIATSAKEVDVSHDHIAHLTENNKNRSSSSSVTGSTPSGSSLALYTSNISVQVPPLSRDTSGANAPVKSTLSFSPKDKSGVRPVSPSASPTPMFFPPNHHQPIKPPEKSSSLSILEEKSVSTSSTSTAVSENLHPATNTLPNPSTVSTICPQLASAHFSMQGVRAEMEDKVVLLPHPQFNTQAGIKDVVPRHYFAVFDGHGGDVSAEYCRQHVHLNFLSDSNFESNPTLAIRSALLRTDHDFCNACRRINLVSSSGTTALCAYILNSQLFVANVGDSRGILSRNGRALAVSNDHKPGRKDEKERIENLGGRVCSTEDIDYATMNTMSAVGSKSSSSSISSFCTHTSCLPIRSLFSPCFTPIRPLRVFPGGLSVSRTIGDLSMKSTALVIAEPEIFTTELTPQDKFLVLACDGVWDVISNQQAANTVEKYLPNVDEAAKQLAKEAFRRGSTDNISVVVVRFIWPVETKKNKKSLKMWKSTASATSTHVQSSTAQSLIANDNRNEKADDNNTTTNNNNPTNDNVEASSTASGKWFR